MIRSRGIEPRIVARPRVTGFPACFSERPIERTDGRWLWHAVIGSNKHKTKVVKGMDRIFIECETPPKRAGSLYVVLSPSRRSIAMRPATMRTLNQGHLEPAVAEQETPVISPWYSSLSVHVAAPGSSHFVAPS